MLMFLRLTVMVVTLLTTVATSQPFTQTDSTKHTGFRWNARKIGNKKVATLTIRKDEERDRRSIPLVDVDDDTLSSGHRSHHRHRHHHGEEGRSSLWLPEAAHTDRMRWEERDRRHQEDGAVRKGLTPLFLAESSLEDRNLMQPGINDVRPATSQSGEALMNIQEVLEATGFHLSPSLFKNNTRMASAARRQTMRGDSESQRTRTPSNENRNKNKAKRRRKKSSKNCRRLKGNRKKRCRAALRKCRKLRGREKKRCRASAGDAPQAQDHNEIFRFIKGKIEMNGTEACQYKYLKECSRKVGMLTDSSSSKATVVKCHFREEFLKCMEEQRQKVCNPNYRIRGNMTAMRKKIRAVVWTPNSCLISEVIEG